MSPTTLLKSTAALTLLLLSVGAAQATPITYQFQLFEQPGSSTVVGKGSFTADVGTSVSGSCGPLFGFSTGCDDSGNPIVSAFTAVLDLSDPLDFAPPSFEFGLAELIGFAWAADGLGNITDYFFTVGTANTTQVLLVADAPNGFQIPGANSTSDLPALNAWFLVGSNMTAVQCRVDPFADMNAPTRCMSTTTVPEPGILALMGLGLAGITAFRRRAAARG